MNAREFFDNVVLMRKYQREYSRSNGKDKEALRYAKDLEGKIDREIARVQHVLKESISPRLEI